jgi:hypothetical protein
MLFHLIPPLLPLDIIPLSKRPTKIVKYLNYVKKTSKRVLFVVWLSIYSILQPFFKFRSVRREWAGMFIHRRPVFRIILYNICNRADNQSIKLKIMCNCITSQRDFAYLVKTHVLSRKIGNWPESGCLKRLVQYFLILVSRQVDMYQLDKLVNPGLSKEEMKAAKQRERERRRRKKAKNKNKKEGE